MARCGLGLADLFADAVIAHSGENPDLPAKNVARALPGELYEQIEGQNAGGSFEVSSQTGQLVQVDEGSGTVAVTVPDAWHSSASSMATAIQTALNASGSLALTYAVGYSTATRKFTIGAPSGFSLINSITTNNLLVSQCGFDGADFGPTTIHLSNAARSSTITHLRFDLGAGGGAPDLIGLMLESVGGADVDPDDLYNVVNVYASNTNLGRLWATWAASASLSLAVSDRPAEDENTLQAAVTSSTTAYRFWFVVWSHIDDKTHHRVRICRGVKMLASTSRQVKEVESHQLYQRTVPISIENQHPVRLASEFRMTVEFDRWGSTDFRAVKVKADRYGSEDGIFFALRWTDIVAATLTVNGEADKGLIFYGSIRASSTDGYDGADSDYMSGSLSFGQLR